MKTGERLGHGMVVTRHFDAPPEEVWDAWTDPARMREWIRPGPDGDARVVLDVRPGGRLEIDMIGGGRTHAHHGEYVEVDRPRRLSFTWVADWLPDGTLVTLELTPSGGGTDLVLRHEKFRTEDMAEKHREGWGGFMEQLAAYLGGD